MNYPAAKCDTPHPLPLSTGGEGWLKAGVRRMKTEASIGELNP
jgi:hypothetical protein